MKKVKSTFLSLVTIIAIVFACATTLQAFSKETPTIDCSVKSEKDCVYVDNGPYSHWYKGEAKPTNPVQP